MDKKISLLNFRELGGIPTNDGRHIKEHCFYRGPAFLEERLTEEDKEILNEIGFKHIVDFRGYDETGKDSTLYIPSGAKYHHLPAIIKNDRVKTDDLNTMSEEGAHMIEEWLVMIYKQLPFGNPAYQQIFDWIKAKETPIYFHCSAGKDRTGVFAALLEALLGVRDDRIYQDYLISHDVYLKFRIEYNHIRADQVRRPSLCFKEWLEGTHDSIIQKYGDYPSFFAHEYGLSSKDIQDIRDYYLI